MHDTMAFELQGHKAAITKMVFSKLLGFKSGDNFSNLELVSSSDILMVYHQMGYKEELVMFSKFMKSLLPLVWNVLFTIML